MVENIAKYVENKAVLSKRQFFQRGGIMYSIKLKCKTTTPLFMAGADGKTPELRPSEFKGMMRWWWRAIKAEEDITNLKREEADIFGGTGEGEERSKVSVKLNYEDTDKGSNLKNDYNKDKKRQILTGEHAGIGYLLYSTVIPQREREYIKKDNIEFEIILESYSEKAFKNAIAALWASIFLGGFGTRARRGGGNISVENVDGDTYGTEFRPTNLNQASISRWLIENFKKVHEIICGKSQPDNFCTAYSNLSFSRILLSKREFTSWIEALNEIGNIFLNFRNKHKWDIFETAVFGLPIIHRNKTKIEGKFIKRRASPLIFKILSFDNKYYWMALRLSGEFLTKGEVLAKKMKDGKIEKTQSPDYRLIDEFWMELKSKANEHLLCKPSIIDKITGEIKKQVNPERIILFGSRARGDAHRNADIDIAVDTNEGVEKIEAIYPGDLVNYRKVSPTLREKIDREGVIIYERKG